MINPKVEDYHWIGNGSIKSFTDGDTPPEITNTGGDYILNENGVELGDNTQIIMGANSEIKNEGEDYTLDDNGLSLNPTGSYNVETSITWGDDFGIGGFVSGNIEQIQHKAGAHRFSDDQNRVSLAIYPGLNGGTVSVPGSIDVGSLVRLPQHTTASRPDATYLDDGSLIYNSDEGRLNYVENGNWTAP